MPIERWLLAPCPRRILTVLALSTLGLADPLAAPRAVAESNLADLSLEQLSRIQVTSVLRRRQPLSDAAASVYVITAEDIRRSGATSLPEALRLAPNLMVARADAVQYAVSARGFNSVLANKMLVLIDGRTVFSPLFSGVFWEAQDVMLEDVERIEIISGPGGTLWGTNAVNGVINIITRQARDTHGPLVSGSIGEDVRTSAFRYGTALGRNADARAYVKAVDRGHGELTNGSRIHDASNRTQGGFRARWNHGGHQVNLQGDAYRSSIEQVPGHRRLTGVNVLGRWSFSFADSSNMRLQAYFDRTTRDQPGSIHDGLNTFDVEFVHDVTPFARHQLLYGAGYRDLPDHVRNLSPGFALIPADHDLRRAQAFAQDDIALRSGLDLILGIKFEYNIFTHWEALPNLRVGWKPLLDHLVWVNLSRAVRAPSRVDREFFSPALPPHFLLAGGPRFRSEVAYVAELGARGQPRPSISYSVTTFLERFDRLRSITPTPDGPEFENGLEARGHGAEGWVAWRVVLPWRLSAGLLEVRRDVTTEPSEVALGGAATLGNDPRYQWTLRSSADLPWSTEWDVMLRRVGPLPVPQVPSYTAVDGRLGCRLPHGMLASVTGQNLFAPSHTEWGPATNRAVFDPSVVFEVEWRP